ncbi:centromere protein O [Sinocyclocheilus anshuiensis]|uniref:Centromere protein O n=1 Tax=Sinocyclocheilus anshuiensis TaxID=1608454 RepID=A0A671N346_9TELE|nr:PREDICTED: centromere protein O [Sinocyclocheilus anshuiensis]
MDGQVETMEQGVLGHLMALERGGMGQQDQHESQRLEMLKVRAVTLRAQRDQLKHQADAVKILKDKISKDLPLDDADAAGGFIELQKSLLTAWRMQLKDLQRAHHLIGGYDLVECKEGKSLCVSFHTAFEGVYLETYNMELDLTRTVQISRHNIPPSFPLESIAKQLLQKDLKGFLQTLSQKLNALAGRRQQVYLLKELVGSVEVMESSQLCNILVLMCTAQGETPKAVLCTLEYGDLTQCLPTRVSIECEDKTLSESPQWKKNQLLLLESPAHTALLTMRRMGSIA